MDLLGHKQADRIKRLEEDNKTLEAKLVDRKLDENSTIHLFQKQCEDLRKRIAELEACEVEKTDLHNAVNKLKQELKTQQALQAEEKRKLESERRKLDDLSAANDKLGEALKSEARSHDQERHELETKLRRVEVMLEKRDAELSELKKLKELDAGNFLSKLSLINDENLSLTSQVKSLTQAREAESATLAKKLADAVKESERLQTQLRAYANLESELVEVHTKHTEAKERAHDLEAKLEEAERRANKELGEAKSAGAQQVRFFIVYAKCCPFIFSPFI